MSRIGFDDKKHPVLLQMRTRSILDPLGLRSTSSITVNFKDGRITDYNTHEVHGSTKIKDYVASDDELKELYGFFTIDNLKKFEAMSEKEKRPYDSGYYDCGALLYLIIMEGGRIIEGSRHGVYSIDPIEMVHKWISNTNIYSP